MKDIGIDFEKYNAEYTSTFGGPDKLNKLNECINEDGNDIDKCKKIINEKNAQFPISILKVLQKYQRMILLLV